jgi:hypothetical protein
MMTTLFQFGERLPQFNVPVLNEREVRAAAGILFFVGLVAFMNAWLMGNFGPTRIMVLGFFADFFIRVAVNPRYAPSLVLGRLAVRKQRPEYVGAPQKRFAWLIGLVLSAIMIYTMVWLRVLGPINFIVCSLCLMLLFLESSFGICLGCWVYNRFNREQAQLCPGDTCEVLEKEEIQKVSLAQFAMLLLFFGLMWGTARMLAGNPLQDPLAVAPASASGPTDKALDPAEQERCRVPDFAIAIGHAEKWKLHNNCK